MQTRNTISNSVKAVLSVGMLTMAMLITNSSNAQSIARVSVHSKDSVTNNIQVKYLGSLEDGVLFNVKYANQTATPFTLVVANADGEVLYEETFSSKDFDKKFLLSRAYDKMSFSIRSDKGKTNQAFAINITTKEIEDVYVRRN